MADAPDDSGARRLGMAILGGALLGFSGWLAWRNLSLSTHSGFIFWVPITLWLVTMGVLCLWSAVSGHEEDSRASIGRIWRMGWIVGGVGLGLGFIGPMVVYPKSNLGPLLGILFTGPAGFVVGAVGAGVMRAVR